MSEPRTEDRETGRESAESETDRDGFGDSTSGVSQIPEQDSAARPLDFERLYVECFPRVWRTARALGVPAAQLDDVCQEVFLTAYQRLEKFEGRSSPSTWIQGFVVHVARRMRRSNARKSPLFKAGADPVVVDDLASPAPLPSDDLGRRQEAALALRILDTLDEEQREILVLVELEECPVVEAAEALGWKLNTAYSRLRVAREAFQRGAVRMQAREKGRAE